MGTNGDWPDQIVNPGSEWWMRRVSKAFYGLFIELCGTFAFRAMQLFERVELDGTTYEIFFVWAYIRRQVDTEEEFEGLFQARGVSREELRKFEKIVVAMEG